MTGAKRLAHWGPTCESGRHYPPHPGDTCDQADEWIAYRDARLEELLAAAVRTPMTDVPPTLRGPNWKPASTCTSKEPAVSYDISLHVQIDTGGPEPIDYCVDDIGNYTSNVAAMWDDALGYRLADLKGKTAADCADDLKRAVADMEQRPEHYKAMNPANGWGDYEGALDYLRHLRNACLAHPKAQIRISH